MLVINGISSLAYSVVLANLKLLEEFPLLSVKLRWLPALLLQGKFYQNSPIRKASSSLITVSLYCRPVITGQGSHS